MGLKRRTFLQFLAGGAVGTLATPVIWQGIDDTAIWTQNFPWIPRIPKGEVEYKPVVSKFCSSFSGAKIGMINGNPVCVSADIDNPFSLGGVSSFAGTEVQMLYSPSRVKTPMIRNANGFESISWEKAIEIVAGKIKESGNSFAVLSGDDTTSVNELLSSILAYQGSGNYFFMPNERQSAQIAWEMLGGKDMLTYQYERSNTIIAIGANVVDTFGLPVRFIKLKEKYESKLLYVGSHANNTYAVADSKYMILPGTEIIFLLGVLSALLNKGYSLPNIEGVQDLQAFIQKYPLAEAIQETTLKKEFFDDFIEKITSAHSPLILAGSPSGSGTPVALVMLSILITQMLAKEGSYPIASVPYPSSVTPLAISFATQMKNDSVSYLHGLSKEVPLKCILTYNANPLYALPATKKMESQWSAISYKIALSSFMDETAMASDIILPLTLSIEGIDDAYTPYGSDKQYYMQTTPCIQPVCDAKTGAEIALLIAQKLGYDLGVQSVQEFFEKKLQQYKTDKTIVTAGVCSMDSTMVPLSPSFSILPLQTYFNAVPVKPRPIAGAREDIHLLPYTQLYMGNPSTSVPPFNVKRIPSTTFKNKEMYAVMNKETAGKMYKNGDTIKITNGEDAIQVKLYIHESVMNNTIALLSGLGHTAFDTFTKNKGVNPMRVLSVENVKEPLLCSWSRNTVQISKV